MNNKAKKAIIKLGDIQLEGYQLPDGSYAMSQNGCKALDILIGDSTGKKYAKPLLALDNLSVEKVHVEGTNALARLMGMETFCTIVSAYAQLGNKKCQAVAFSCLVESLERRLDHAFNIQRTEEERNDRLQTRVESKIARRTLTDSFKYYLENNPELSSNYKKYIYPNSTDYLNGLVLGVKSKQAKDHYQLKESGAIRDHIPTEALRELKFAEELASRFIVEDGLEPFEAVKKACEIGKIKQIGLE
jgi:hypothetical protein